MLLFTVDKYKLEIIICGNFYSLSACMLKYEFSLHTGFPVMLAIAIFDMHMLIIGMIILPK